jgi:chromosome segregation ATPase
MLNGVKPLEIPSVNDNPAYFESITAGSNSLAKRMNKTMDDAAEVFSLNARSPFTLSKDFSKGETGIKELQTSKQLIVDNRKTAIGRLSATKMEREGFQQQLEKTANMPAGSLRDDAGKRLSVTLKNLDDQIKGLETVIDGFDAMEADANSKINQLQQAQAGALREAFSMADTIRDFREKLADLNERRAEVASKTSPTRYTGGSTSAEGLRGSIQAGMIDAANNEVAAQRERDEKLKEMAEIDKQILRANIDQVTWQQRSTDALKAFLSTIKELEPAAVSY